MYNIFVFSKIRNYNFSCALLLIVRRHLFPVPFCPLPFIPTFVETIICKQKSWLHDSSNMATFTTHLPGQSARGHPTLGYPVLWLSTRRAASSILAQVIGSHAPDARGRIYLYAQPLDNDCPHLLPPPPLPPPHTKPTPAILLSSTTDETEMIFNRSTPVELQPSPYYLLHLPSFFLYFNIFCSSPHINSKCFHWICAMLEF